MKKRTKTKICKPDLRWDYDKEADVMYISFGKPKSCLTDEQGDCLLLRYYGEQSMLNGITITNYSHSTTDKIHANI